MKKLFILIAIALPLVAQSQIFATYTNLTLTNYFAASSTYTGTGTNYLDATRNTEIGLVARGAGAGTATNTVTFTLQGSHDRTNWFATPFAIALTVNGTNSSIAFTNINVSTIGYLRGYQVINAAGNAVTNCSLTAILKGYRRDQ